MRQVIAGLAFIWVMLSCTTEDAFTAGTGETPAQFIERQCKEQMITCARVYAYETPADNPLGQVEMCTRAEDLASATAMYGAAELSPDARFDQWRLLGVEPICWWQCPSAKGCNSYTGCWCPGTPRRGLDAGDMQLLEGMLFPVN
jgi:hypothetical protein